MKGMGSTKTMRDFFQPAKRIKVSVSSSSDSVTDTSSSSLAAVQKSRIEFNKLRANSKRNLNFCLQLVSKSKSEGVGYVKLEELLVEKTWLEVLPGELQKPYARTLCKFLENEICSGDVTIYPPQHLIFNALNSTPFDTVKAVIIGQDPYHGPGQAMGLSFSVPEGVKSPSSLVNIFKELKQDLGCSIPSHGNLERWAIQGVLLLNTVLTVGSHQANSHAKKGWEQFTDSVIKTISQKKEGVVFLLWGNYAQEKSRTSGSIFVVLQKERTKKGSPNQGSGGPTRDVTLGALVDPFGEKKSERVRCSRFKRLIDGTKHYILKAAHPSGLSANRGFFGCRHFSQTNKLLGQKGIPPIDWQLPFDN